MKGSERHRAVPGTPIPAPLAAAAGLAALDIYRDEGLFWRARSLPIWPTR
jgi:hypothetical protein